MMLDYFIKNSDSSIMQMKLKVSSRTKNYHHNSLQEYLKTNCDTQNLLINSVTDDTINVSAVRSGGSEFRFDRFSNSLMGIVDGENRIYFHFKDKRIREYLYNNVLMSRTEVFDDMIIHGNNSFKSFVVYSSVPSKQLTSSVYPYVIMDYHSGKLGRDLGYTISEIFSKYLIL